MSLLHSEPSGRWPWFSFETLGVMTPCRFIIVAALAVFFVGCAHSPSAVQSPENVSGAKAVVITVYVEGGVNKPGKLDLSYPFTVEHALQQAGGLDWYEGKLNRNVLVAHKNGQPLTVSRKDYAAFTLEDGDGIGVPRH